MHEDQGAMGTVEVINGCDALYEDYAGDGACQVYQCEDPTEDPTPKKRKKNRRNKRRSSETFSSDGGSDAYDSSDGGSDAYDSSVDSSDELGIAAAEALSIPDNNALPDVKLTKYYSLTVQLGNDADAWIYVCFIVGVFLLCNGMLVFYWWNSKSNAKKTQTSKMSY
eukprot:UN06276